MKVQFSLCAKDLPEAASYKALVKLGDDDDTTILGTTEASSATTNPVWSHMVCPADDDVPDDATVTVQVVKATTESDVVATSTFDLQAVTGSYYQAAASFTTQQADDGAKIALHASPPRMGTLRVQLAGADLPDTDFGMFRKQHTDACFELYSAVTGKKLVRSNVVEDELNPLWQSMDLDLDVLCGGRLDAPIRLTVLDKDAGDETQYLGQVMLTVNQMLGQGDGVLKHYPLIKGGTTSAQGSISVKTAELLPAKLATREAHKHLQLVLTALDAQRDELMEQVSAKQQAADDAKAKATQAQDAVDALQQEIQASAEAQAAVQSKLAALKQEHATLQAKASATPCTGKLILTLRAEDLPDTDFGFRNKTDPIFEVVVRHAKILRSNIVEDDLNPTWDPVTIDLDALGGKRDESFKIIVSDKDGGDNQTAIGTVDVTVNGLLAAVGSSQGQALSKGKGKLFVKTAELQDLVDNMAKAKEYYTTSIQPVADECTTVTQAFEAARAKMDQARDAAATAQEEAQKAQDEAESAKLALEMMEKSG